MCLLSARLAGLRGLSGVLSSVFFMGCLLRVHEDSVVAVCDEDIVGKKFFLNDLVVDVDSDFFGGKPASVDEVLDAVRGAASVNAVGNDVVGLLVEHGVVSANGVRVVDGVRVAHVYRV